MAKKMVLIDPRVLESLKASSLSPLKNPIESSLSSLNQELTDTLDDNTGDTNKQAIDYQQALRRFLQLADQFRNQPIGKVEISKDTTVPPFVTENSELPTSMEQKVMDSVPKSLKEKARLLLQHVKSIPELKWGPRGELIEGGRTIPGAHISNLINDVVRARKKTISSPEGLESFTRLLKTSNVSRDLIPNVLRREEAGRDRSPSIVDLFDERLSTGRSVSKEGASASPLYGSRTRGGRRRGGRAHYSLSPHRAPAAVTLPWLNILK